MKSLSGKLGVIFAIIGFAIFGCGGVWGTDSKHYGTTDIGYIFFPRIPNNKALVYCHGGLELGKKLMLMYGLKDDLIPVWQGIELFKKTNCKIILVEKGHGLFNELQNVKKAEEFLDN